MSKHIAIYVRVSGKQQDTRSQEPDLRKWITAYSGDDKVVWYRDTFTGRTMDRPGWNRLQAALNAGNVSKVVVWRLDRLGRTASGLTKLFDELQDGDIGLVSIKEGLDLGTPAGRFIANVMASAAQFETELRMERVLAGQAAAREAGKKWGGSKAGRLLHVTTEQVEQIRRLHREGVNKSAMAKATGLSRPTIYRILAQHIA